MWVQLLYGIYRISIGYWIDNQYKYRGGNIKDL